MCLSGYVAALLINGLRFELNGVVISLVTPTSRKGYAYRGRWHSGGWRATATSTSTATHTFRRVSFCVTVRANTSTTSSLVKDDTTEISRSLRSKMRVCALTSSNARSNSFLRFWGAAAFFLQKCGRVQSPDPGVVEGASTFRSHDKTSSALISPKQPPLGKASIKCPALGHGTPRRLAFGRPSDQETPRFDNPPPPAVECKGRRAACAALREPYVDAATKKVSLSEAPFTVIENTYRT